MNAIRTPEQDLRAALDEYLRATRGRGLQWAKNPKPKRTPDFPPERIYNCVPLVP